jgi:hypothetical protein
MFYSYFILCCTRFLCFGLDNSEVASIDLKRLKQGTSEDFVDFIKGYLKLDTWYSVGEIRDSLVALNEDFETSKFSITNRTIKNWIQTYADTFKYNIFFMKKRLNGATNPVSSVLLTTNKDFKCTDDAPEYKDENDIKEFMTNV